MFLLMLFQWLVMNPKNRIVATQATPFISLLFNLLNGVAGVALCP